MRISKVTLSALTVAGALALAGCGGGGDSMDDMDMDDEKDDEVVVEEKTAATVGLDGKRLAAGSVDRVIKIPATGEETKVDDVYFTCAVGTEACVITIPAGESVFEVSYTGGTLTASATKKAPTVADAPETGNWLSAASIVGAIPADGDDAVTSPDSLSLTIGGVKRTIVANPDTAGARQTTPDDKVDQLILRHDRGSQADGDFIVWGSWMEPVEGTGSDKPRQVWGGSVPYKGTPPKTAGGATNKAIYVAADGVHGFSNGTPWTSDVRMEADFDDQTVKGAIGEGLTATVTTPTGPVDLDGTANDFFSITLKQTGIGSTMSGSVTVAGDNDATIDGQKNAPSSGTWKAGFFGAESAGSTTPGGIAGEFSVTRPKAGRTPTTATDPHKRVGALSISGAFGASGVTQQ